MSLHLKFQALGEKIHAESYTLFKMIRILMYCKRQILGSVIEANGGVPQHELPLCAHDSLAMYAHFPAPFSLTPSYTASFPCASGKISYEWTARANCGL